MTNSRTRSGPLVRPLLLGDSAAKRGAPAAPGLFAGHHHRAPRERRERAAQLAHARRHLSRATPLAADRDQQGHARPARARLVLRIRYVSRPGSDAARRRRRALHDERLEQSLCAERGNGRADLELRPESARRRRRESLLRRELARRGALHEQAHHRDARRPAHRARPRDGHTGLEHRHRRSDEDVHDHGRAARREGQGRHRQRGAEFGVRGYVSAYDADTGELAWRFYVVPGDPAAGPDGAASDKALAEIAAPTWFGRWYEMGGGGTRGTRSFTTPSSISSTSARATAAPGIA